MSTYQDLQVSDALGEWLVANVERGAMGRVKASDLFRAFRADNPGVSRNAFSRQMAEQFPEIRKIKSSGIYYCEIRLIPKSAGGSGV